jgi:hypothetical protein
MKEFSMVEVEFYNVKKRKKVKISSYTKVKYPRTTDNGVQYRYAFRCEDDGTKLTKFCSEKDWNASAAPETKA